MAEQETPEPQEVGSCANCGKPLGHLIKNSHGICPECSEKLFNDPKTQERMRERDELIRQMEEQATAEQEDEK